MASQNSLKLHQSPLGGVLPECWKLAPDRALTLQPDSAGILSVSQGRVWVTSEGPHQGPANDWGDVVLGSGQQLRLLAGQQVVIEAYGEAVNAPAFFSWEPSSAPVLRQRVVAVPWGDALARPRWMPGPSGPGLSAMISRSMIQLGCLLQWFVQGRGRVLSPLECNQP